MLAVTSNNSLDITLLKPEIDFSLYDYFILTSKQSVKALKQYKSTDLKPAVCISKQTAQAYESIGGEVLGIGLGYGDNLKDEIARHPKAIRWLYLRAEVVASDFISSLKDNGYKVDESILYKSECSKEIAGINVKEKATLIFTSPSSVKCFLKNNTISIFWGIIVIGKSTAKSLPQGIKYLIAKEKTIESCLSLINE